MTQPTEPPRVRYSCRFPLLAEVLALVDGVTLPDEPPCERPAVWATGVDRERDGQDIETVTRLCEHHDQQVRALPGYIEPTRLLLPIVDH